MLLSLRLKSIELTSLSVDASCLITVPVLQQESGAVSYYNLVRDRADKTGVWFYGELAGERKCTVLWYFNIVARF